MTPHDHAQALVASLPDSSKLNEADTRHRVIDCVLHDVLAWPRASTPCESYIDPGFADYVLLGRREGQILFIEAKRAGKYFTLPAKRGRSKKNETHFRYEAVKTLLTDPTINEAVSQVREYCLNSGCEYAAITNGSQWIFFRVFVKNQDWRKLSAYVIEDLRYFDVSFAEATKHFAYTSITSKASLSELFGDAKGDNRPRFFPKETIVAYDHEVTANYLAPSMRPLVERYFGRMNAQDTDFMDKCYVNTREYRVSEDNVKQLIHDSLSPYFRDYKVKDFFADKGGGDFGERITSSARDRRTRDVIVLFGGKGAGKSTFMSRLLFHKPPNSIKYFTKIAVVDLLECPEDHATIEAETWKQLIDKLDSDKVLGGSRDDLLKLFDDRYAIARRQSLAGLDEGGEAFNVRLNALVDEWKKDEPYCAVKLADYWRRRQKGLVIVLDNTDQFSPANQDFCFTLAHKISTDLDCLVVISMREERFHYSKIHGTLDAFQNSGFHLTSPAPAKLFRLRLIYVLRILNDPPKARKISPELTASELEKIQVLMRIYLREFGRSHSHLNSFVRACAHGNMRLALDLFRQYVLSGYTRVDEMIANPRWTLQVHQVLRPMMVPYRLFYDERKSSIPNIFQIRSEENGSHFTALRLLDMLSKGPKAVNPDYVAVSKIRAYFADTFNMLDDVEKNLDVFLRGGVVESNNRVDEYVDTIDSVKITPYGRYIFDVLSHNFSYLDLVCLDCGIHDEGVANSLSELGNKDRDLFLDFKKRERITARIRKVRTFLDYLSHEENIEREGYGLDASDKKFMDVLRPAYDIDEQRVIRSANRNYGSDPSLDADGSEVNEGDDESGEETIPAFD
ncbi:MAG: hypothetical protein DWQ37_05335 [Planctomycetota bacterium]|nr:MAG: hypothetical protein DWQ37_05335 [Planctomycetota bacterium]